MALNKRIAITLLVLIITTLTAILWLERYPITYNYYLWRLNHTSEGGEIIDIHENIESISSHIIPLLIKSYKNTRASSRSRHAAAYGLIKADKNTAEELFITYLNNKDDVILESAILHLSLAKSIKPYSRIIQFANHPNARVRRAVADYLGNFNDAESISLLKYFAENDQDNEVRTQAEYQLYQLGVIER